MSHKLLTAALLFFYLSLQKTSAQISFFEDFEQGIPGSFTLHNEDGLTPEANVAYVTDAWVARANFDDTSDTVACSTSWYNPIGESDDWMVTPLISIDSPSILTWDAKSQDDGFLESYEVRISTAGTDPADFLANAPLFSTTGEQGVWTLRSVNLATAGYKNQDVYIAFRNISYDKFLLLIDDIKVWVPFSTDAKAVSLDIPLSSCVLGSNEMISISIENFGLTPISNFSVSYVVNDGVNSDTITETITSSIAPGATLDYTFTQGADFSVAGSTYTVDAFITLAGDGDNNNNVFEQAALANVESVAPSSASPYATSFESVSEILGWSVEDANNDGFTWGLGNGADYASTGNIGFVYYWNNDGTTAPNDWLFSTCLDLVPGKNYLLTFQTRVGAAGGTVYTEKLKVTLNSSPDAGSVSQTLADFDSLVNDFFEGKEIIFTVSTAGTYYIGFHCYSDPDDYFLSLDDVNLTELLAPSASFTTGKNELQVTFLSTSTGVIDSLHWDLGDGQVSNSSSVVHTYTTPGDYYVCLIAVNSVGADTACQIISVDTISGISILNNALLKIYPSPNSGFVIIETDRIMSALQVSLHDLSGKELLNEKLPTVKSVLNLSSFTDGVYFITVQSGNTYIREKLVLSR